MLRPSKISLFMQASLIIALSQPSVAKGLDEIQPRTEEEKVEDASNAPQQTAPAATTTPADATAPAAAVPAAESAPLTKSALSQKLEDRFSLGMSLGFVTIPKAKNGDYYAYSGADIFAHWKTWSNEKAAITATMRYLPIEAENQIDGKSYNAVIEGYFIGGIYEWLLTQSLSVFTGIELGYLVVHLDSVDSFKVSSSDEANKFAYGLATGLDWLATQKLKLGPRINVAFGDYQIAQYAGAITLLF